MSRSINASARWHRVLMATLTGSVVLRKCSRLKAGETSGSNGDSDGPPQASDTTQACQLPVKASYHPDEVPLGTEVIKTFDRRDNTVRINFDSNL
jgi:hypothetical protein